MEDTVLVCLLYGLVCATLLVCSPAHAEDEEMLGTNMLSLTGDGVTASAVDLRGAAERTAQSAQYGASASQGGDASYSIPISLPSARLTPQVALAYSSGGSVTELGRGWSLAVGPQVYAAYGPGFQGYPEGTYIVGGGGLDGLLIPTSIDFTGAIPSPNSVVWRSSQPGYVDSEYDSQNDRWTLHAGGMTYTFISTGGHAWNISHYKDLHGNRVDYVWETPHQLEEIQYGGTSKADHFLRVKFNYAQAVCDGVVGSGDQSCVRRRVEHGTLRTVSDRLVSIAVETRYGQALGNTPSWPTARTAYRYDLWYDAEPVSYLTQTQVPGLEEHLEEVSLVELDAAGNDTSSQLVAAFGYTPWTTASHQETGLSNLQLHYTVANSAQHMIDLTTQVDSPEDTRSIQVWGVNSTHHDFADVDHDGLPDSVTLYASDAHVNPMVADASRFSWPWEDPFVTTSDMDADPDADPPVPVADTSLGRTYTVLLDNAVDNADNDSVVDYGEPLLYGTYGMSAWMDLDGDGYRDLVVTSADPPAGIDAADAGVPQTVTAPSLAAQNEGTASTEWWVWYGTPTGMEEVAVSETAPFKYLSVSHRTTSGAGYSSSDGPSLQLLDIDGDGWQEILEFDGGWVRAYERQGGRGSGWSMTERDLFSPSLATGLEVVEAEYTTVYISDLGENVTYAKYNHIIAGFRDLTGDGLVDFVQVSGDNWDVRINKGWYFELPRTWPAPNDSLGTSEEGVPSVDANDCMMEGVPSLPGVNVGENTGPWWGTQGPNDLTSIPGLETNSTNSGSSQTVNGVVRTGDPCANGVVGTPSFVVKGLLDMDGDGLPDYIDGDSGDGVWYRNLGGGFDLEKRPLPDWFPTEGGEKVLSVTESTQVIVVRGGDLSTTSQVVAVRDVNGDGLPDVVRSGGNLDTVTYSGVLSNPADLDESVGVRPGLLSQIEWGTGAQTNLTYTSSSVVEPVEENGPHDGLNSNVLKPLVASLEVRDPITGWAARQERVYRGAVSEYGRLWGFESVETRRYSWEPDFPTEESPHQAVGWSRLGTTDTTYSLDRYWALPVERCSEGVREIVPNASAVTWELQCTEWQYGYPGFPTSGTIAHYKPTDQISELPVSITSTRFARDNENAAPQIFTVSMEWDANANLLWQHHVSPDPAHLDDELYVETDWLQVGTGSNHWLPYTMTTASGPDLSSDVISERIAYAYDGLPFGVAPDPGNYPSQRALMTMETVCGDTTVAATGCSPNEELFWSFSHGPRGELTTTTQLFNDPAKNRVHRYHGFAFGGAVPVSEENAVGHLSSAIVDDLGRVTETTDANGVKQFTTYDALGRVVQTEVQGVGGQRMIKSTTTYEDSGYPRAVRTQTYRDNVVVTESLQQMDGFGRPLVAWEPHPDNMSWVVTATETDARGLTRWSSVPQNKTALPAGVTNSLQAGADYAAGRGETMTWTTYGLMGMPISSFAEGAGTTSHSEPDSGTTRTTDADGFVKELIHDTHGRLIAVHEGTLQVPPTPTGLYEYDTRGRVTAFQDGAGNRWEYDFDGAGRLQAVARQAQGGLVTDYYGYVWEGTEPVELHEGAVGGIGTWDTRWAYDALGRTVQKDVRNADHTQPFLQYSWTWDTAPGGAVWNGVAHVVNDPAGYVEFTYGAHPTYGSLGYVTDTTRTFTSVTPDKVVSMSSTYDEDGRALTLGWPSGSTVTTSYKPTGAVYQANYDSPADGVSALMEAHYDFLGAPSGWGLDYLDAASATPTVPRSWNLDIVVDPASRVTQGLWWYAPAGAPVGDHQMTYAYNANGDLRCKDPQVGDDAICYTYDHWHRINGVYDGDPAGPGPVAVHESYAYDASSSPVTVQRGINTWAYAPPTGFNEVPSRHSTVTGQVDTFAYDNPVTGGPQLGRLRMWDTTGSAQRDFAYDGAGRLGLMQRLDVGAPGPSTTTYLYDSKNEVVHEQRSGPGAGNIFRFAGWQERAGMVLETPLPMLRKVGNEHRVILSEPDGRAVWTADPTGTMETQEVVGAYNMPLPGYTVVPAGWSSWVLDSMHGGEVSRGDDIMHLGARHMALRDGLWLQPEPLLHLGVQSGNPAAPLSFSGLYASGDTGANKDRSGYVVQGVAKAIQVGVKAFEAVSLVADVVATVHVAQQWQSGQISDAAAHLHIQELVTGSTKLGPASTAGTKLMVEAATSAVDSARAALRGAGCFVAGTQIVTPAGGDSIEAVAVGHRVLTAASTDGDDEFWAEVEDASAEESGAWAPRGVCDRVTAWAPKWAMPAMVALAACGAEPEPPAANDVVQVCDARTGGWSEAVGAELEVGDTWLEDGRLHRWTGDGVEDRGAASVDDVAEADATWTAEAATRVPGTDDWVLVLGEAEDAGHWRLGAVEAGARFAYQGRVFETADADGDGLIEVRPTGDVLGRVVNTFVRIAPEIIDADIEYADGSTDTLTGTPNHPFWVDAVRDYVPLGELEVGTVLHVQGGGEAILFSKTWRQGDFEVFDFEVEGLHNFYVRGPRSGAAGVLVHNSTGSETLVRRCCAAEADAMMEAGGLVPKPGSRGAKWISEGAGQASLPTRGHEKTVTMTVEAGTTDRLRSMATDFMDVSGEAALPGGVLTKSNEPGALGIGVGLIEEFNSTVTKVDVR